MAEPRRPRTVVRDPAEARNQRGRTLRVAAREARLAFVEHRLVESGAAASRLIDDVARHAVADEVRIPAFATIGCRLETGAGVRGSVDHDHGPATAVLLGRNLKLHVHLTNRDLLGSDWRWRRGRGGARTGRPRYDGVVGDLLNAADEEAALVFDGQRAAQKLFRRLAGLPGGSYGQGHYQHSHRSGTSHLDLLGGQGIASQSVADRCRGRREASSPPS